jgi:toxin ParE1/3/4
MARADLLAHYIYLYEEAGEAVANRFLDSAEKSFAILVEHPHIGVAITLRAPELAGMRKWAVDGFPNYLICMCQDHRAR